MSSASSPRARRRSAWILVAALAACRANPPAAELATLRAQARPSLEDIFALPGMQGRPPRLEHVSYDGRWAWFRHDALGFDASGARTLPDRPTLRVISLDAPEATARAGRSVEDLLPEPPAPAATAERMPAVERGPGPAARAQGASGALPRRGSGNVSIVHAHRSALALARRDDRLYLLAPPADPRGSWTAALLLDGTAEAAWKGFGDPRFTENDDALLVEAGGELWRLPFDARALPAKPWAPTDGENLTAAIEPKVDKLVFSRDLSVVFCREAPVGRLEVPATDTTPASTKPAQILWRADGRLVALEGFETEGGPRGLENPQLSPDGRFLFASLSQRDNDGVPTLIPDYLTARVTTRRGRSDLADDGPFPRKLFLWDTSSGARRELDPGAPQTFGLRNLGWAPALEPGAPPRLAFARLSADYRRLDAYLWTEQGGLVPLWSDEDARWIGGPVDRMRWTSDGRRIVFGSESFAGSSTPGRAQLFSIDVEERVVRQLTRVDGEVASFDLGRDGTLAYSFNTRARPDRFELAWLDRAGREQRVDAPIGCNMDPSLADGGGRAVFVHGSMFRPGELYVARLEPGAAAVPLTDGAPRDFLARDWIRPERLEVAGPEGARVSSHVFLPRESSLTHPDRPRAGIVFIHGAGYLQNVTDSMTEYEPNLMFHSRLAGMGYVVVDVDYRGSAGYGGAFRTDVQYRLGELELADIGATLDELARRGVLDRARVGCYGGSYGGFLTLMALCTEGERWRAGAALRSVTDWRTYGPSYTQPRLGKPSTHAEAYARSSPIDHAAGLSRPVLLLHGMVDDNVFAQDTIRMMEALIDLGKEFEVMLYPSQSHAFTDGPHWIDEYKRIERFLTEHVGAP